MHTFAAFLEIKENDGWTDWLEGLYAELASIMDLEDDRDKVVAHMRKHGVTEIDLKGLFHHMSPKQAAHHLLTRM